MSRFVYAAQVATTWLSLCGLANAAVEVGWVEAATSQHGTTVIQRGPERVSVTRFQTLQVGDVLSATEDARIDIRLGEDRNVFAVTAANSPYLIQRVGEVPRVWSKMLGWLQELALRKVGKEKFGGDRVAIAASRAGNANFELLSFGMFSNPEYFLLAGQRDLHLVWHGGVAPFSVYLTNKQTNAVIGQQASVSVRETTLTSVALEPDIYLLRVADAKGASHLMRIAVLERNAEPHTNGFLGSELLTEPQRTLANAMELATQPSKKWQFEAYQQLSTIDSPEALFLREAILRGDALPHFNP